MIAMITASTGWATGVHPLLVQHPEKRIYILRVASLFTQHLFSQYLIFEDCVELVSLRVLTGLRSMKENSYSYQCLQLKSLWYIGDIC